MLERVLLRFPVRSRLSQISPHVHRSIAVRLPLALSIRTYATPGRPKSVVGEPSRAVKRAVKKAASTPNDGSSAAEKKVAAKKTAVKKTVAKKTVAKKARKPTTKKLLTPEQVAKRQADADKRAARAAARKERAALRKAVDKQKMKLLDLKAAALSDVPKKTGYNSAYQVYWTEHVKGPLSAGETINVKVKEVAAKWKKLSPAEIEHYNHVRRTANEVAEAEYKRWIESHSPDEIRIANLARKQLRRQVPSQATKWAPLEDERRPKRPSSAYMTFSLNRQSSGDFANIKVGERARLIVQEWKALSASEQAKYQEISQQDQKRYRDEHMRIYGHEPPAVKAAAAAAAAAAA